MPFARSVLTLFTLFLLCQLSGCQQSPGKPANPKIDTIPQPATESFTTTRDRLIGALKELRQLADTTDSFKVARMFRFPIADTLIALSGDSLFESEKQKNGGYISEQLFFAGYRRFIAQLQLDEMQAAFKQLDVNKLRKSDSLGYLEKGSKQACLHSYQIKIEKDSFLRVEASLISNDAYKGKKDDDDMGCPEYLLWWVFAFDGHKLYLVNHAEAD